ncbi:MAG: ArsA family ATPase [Candidatus Odinarchaeum yellowstonii]|uniref:ArsA family ATPase n=1 Tax=Odinarchaeota yellowstonii (strain LCB_4) TaxID=1841599 RepID=A0AAF0IAZ6_ODILC|nr:MAG: ArsA family ATPase [Candidatus Odinarchaeum yellowstonii]
MTLNDLIIDKPRKFLLFGGKGGVGKTSNAAASAIWAAEHGYETLIISTDPAHSLSDSLNQDVSGGEIKIVHGVDNLFAMEVNPKKEFQKYQETVSGSSFNSVSPPFPIPDLLTDLSGLTPPGADEALAFSKVLEFIGSSEYDLIIFDTAPTGHTLRLLSLPDLLNSFFGKLLTFRLRLSAIWDRFKSFFSRGESGRDDSLEKLEILKKNIETASSELSDPNKTSFIVVMIPEAMAIYETERLLSTLYEYEIPVDHIIVNMIYPDIPDCVFCRSRKAMQDKYLKEIHALYSDFNITKVPLFNDEIRGIPKLKELAGILFE